MARTMNQWSSVLIGNIFSIEFVGLLRIGADDAGDEAHIDGRVLGSRSASSRLSVRTAAGTRATSGFSR